MSDIRKRDLAVKRGCQRFRNLNYGGRIKRGFTYKFADNLMIIFSVSAP